MKKRYIILICVALMIVLGSWLLPPVRPFIQLPGEVYPGTDSWPIIGPIFGGLTNTFMSAVVAWIVVALMAFSLRARSRTADEIPSGFYNFFEMVIEGAYGFAENIAGAKVKFFFPLFMTFVLYILVTNWMGLIPGWDSIGLWENKAVFGLHQAEKFGEEIGDPEEYLAKIDEENKGDLRSGLWLLRKSRFADANAEIETHVITVKTHGEAHEGEEAHGGEVEFVEKLGTNPEAADWTIVPFFRPGATDLNYTLAFAIVAMVMVQAYGIRFLGIRGHLAKFFPFIGAGFGAEVAKNPIRAIDVFVGFLELISEFSKIISFAFRLLGNIFAGMVLLFVMAFLLPIANIAFFGLEFFVGLIQALVFGLLMLIFMVSASESHHGDDH